MDRATSQRLARAVGARGRGCYRNALRALPRLNDATYVEGVVVIQQGLSLDHAWVESAAGVVDPTPVYAAMAEGACSHFAGPRWTLDKGLPLLSGEHQFGSPAVARNHGRPLRHAAPSVPRQSTISKLSNSASGVYHAMVFRECHAFGYCSGAASIWGFRI